MTPYQEVAEAAAGYESRWTVNSLRAVNPELHATFIEQQDLWNQAMVTGSQSEVRAHTGAMCRGWAAITKVMEGRPDDAYMLGICPRTGTRVAITQQRATMARVQELHGERVIMLSPDECAVLLGAQQAVASIQRVFPGAEVLQLYPVEPAKADAA